MALCGADPWDDALALAVDAGVTRLAVESSAPYKVVERARASFAGEIVPVDGWVEAVRVVKDAGEVARIAEAQELTDAAFDHILDFVSAGMTETQVALEIEFFMRSDGSDGIAFPPIVASGPNSALPHAHPGSRELEHGDFLKMDFGARVGGYCADMTRTVVHRDRQRPAARDLRRGPGGEPGRHRRGQAGPRGARYRRRCALGASRRPVSARTSGTDLATASGSRSTSCPVSARAAPAPVPLGSVVTVEPGIYVPGFGGVRIEDLVVVEEAGARVLTRSTKELIEL